MQTRVVTHFVELPPVQLSEKERFFALLRMTLDGVVILKEVKDLELK
jgi:hypothetical protein